MKNSKVLGLIIVAALLGGVFIMSKNQANPSKSVAQGGQSVSSQLQEDSTSQNSTYVHIHSIFRIPTDGTILMGAHTGLFKSTDIGKTFVRAQINSSDSTINPNGEFMNFAYDSTNKILFAGTHDSGLLKSTDFGVTWSRTDEGIEGHDIHGLAINPLETNRIYAYSVDRGVFGTKDGAKSWYKIDEGPKNPNVKSFAYMATPSSMDRGMKTDKTTNIGYLWAGTGGGLYSSFACFCGWTQAPIPSSATVYALAADPINRSVMLLSKKDGIYQTTDEGQNFKQISSDVKDVGAMWFDIADPKLVLAATNNGVIYKSEDGGKTWNKTQ